LRKIEKSEREKQDLRLNHKIREELWN